MTVPTILSEGTLWSSQVVEKIVLQAAVLRPVLQLEVQRMDEDKFILDGRRK